MTICLASTYIINMTNVTGAGPPGREPLAYYVILGILGSLAIIFNGLLLYVIWRTKTPEFRFGTCYVIGNLALADFLTGIRSIRLLCMC